MARILQLSSQFPYPPDDGRRIATWNLSRCLAYNGYHLDLVCLAKEAREESTHRAALAEVFVSVVKVPKDVQRQYPKDLVVSLATGTSYMARKYYSARLAAGLRERLRAQRYDIVLIEDLYMGVYLPVLREHPGSVGRVILREHNIEHELFGRAASQAANPLLRGLLRREARLLRAFELALVQEVRDVRAISRRDAAILQALGAGGAVTVLDPFIDVDSYRPLLDTPVEPCSVVSVAHMSWPPNVNGILWFLEKVWPGVVRLYPRARFYIVGKNPPPGLRRLAGRNVIITGYVADEKPFLARAHLFIVPLWEGSGVRIKILTALAMGKEVLSTSVGAEGIPWPGLLIEDRADAWVTRIQDRFRRLPEVAPDAIAFVRQHYHWRRPLQL
jgi:glycosyltransferase involved in cell wall biosynthesis